LILRIDSDDIELEHSRNFILLLVRKNGSIRERVAIHKGRGEIGVINDVEILTQFENVYKVHHNLIEQRDANGLGYWVRIMLATIILDTRTPREVLTGTRSVMLSSSSPKGLIWQKVAATPPLLVILTGGQVKLKSKVNSNDPGEQPQRSAPLSSPMSAEIIPRKTAEEPDSEPGWRPNELVVR
jgi:hypothetical protein